jgi:hypothetical protein
MREDFDEHTTTGSGGQASQHKASTRPGRPEREGGTETRQAQPTRHATPARLEAAEHAQKKAVGPDLNLDLEAPDPAPAPLLSIDCRCDAHAACTLWPVCACECHPEMKLEAALLAELEAGHWQSVLRTLLNLRCLRVLRREERGGVSC